MADYPGCCAEGGGEPAPGQVPLCAELLRRGGYLPGALPRTAGRPAPSASHPALCQGGRPGLGGVQAESHLPGGAAGASLGSLAGVCGGALEPLVRGPRGRCPPPGGLVYAAGDRVRGGPDRGHRSRRGPGSAQDPPAQDGAGGRAGAHGAAASLRLRDPVSAHAALRHISRLRAAGLWLRGGPLFPDAAGGTWAKGDAVLLFRRVLLAAGVALTTVDHEGHVVQLFAGHAARVAGAAWLASRGVPTPIIQLLGRWSSTAVERYVQAAPLALAPEIPGRVLAGGGTRRSRPGGLPQAVLHLTRPRWCSRAAHPAGRGGRLLPGSAPGPGPTTGLGIDPPACEDLIFNEKGAKVHRPDPAEDSTEQFLWRSRCGAWPYGIRRFFRVSEKPASAAWCAQCFPVSAAGNGEHSPTEPEDSPVASSSASESDSSSS